jgi:NAD(P)H-flavin reductase
VNDYEGLLMQDKFKDWEASGVEVVPVLSQPHNNWTGEQGYVQVNVFLHFYMCC